MNSSPAASHARPLALVTGASSGTGTDLARELARGGHDLVLVAQHEAHLLELAKELAVHQVRVTIIPANLGDIDAASRLVCELGRRQLGEVEVLVIHNAGCGGHGGFTHAEPTKLAEVLQFNVAALTTLTRAFLPGMVARRRGQVLLAGNFSGPAPGPAAAVCHATRAYVLSLAAALRQELRGTGVTITAACPGLAQGGFRTAGAPEVSPSQSRLGSMPPAAVSRQVVTPLVAGRPGLAPEPAGKPCARWLCLAPPALVSAGLWVAARRGT